MASVMRKMCDERNIRQMRSQRVRDNKWDVLDAWKIEHDDEKCNHGSDDDGSVRWIVWNGSGVVAITRGG